VGGIAGGAIVDSLVRIVGPIHLLLLCAGLCVSCAALVRLSERRLHPRPRALEPVAALGVAAATEGARVVFRSRYLLSIVGVVIAYEFAAAMTDFVVNVVFERAFQSEVELARMFGRLGWIVSIAALASQIVIVPALLPRKRVALLAPPIALGLAAFGLALAPIVGMAILLSVADRGLNYSLQQATKETLYVPLSDVQRYKGKAFIDMFVDRIGKALSALALIVVIALTGVSIRVSLLVALGAVVVWTLCAGALGRAYLRAHPREPGTSTQPGAASSAGSARR
jgi:AAA family ATP:ADP antiporter